MHDAEGGAEAVCPLKRVQEAPGKIGCQVDTVTQHCLAHTVQVLPELLLLWRHQGKK